MGDKFPKEYVTERLEARRESLKSKLADGEAANKAWLVSEDPKALAWITDVKAKLVQLAEVPLPDTDVFKHVDKLTRALHDLEYSAPKSPSNRWRSDVPFDVSVWMNSRSAWLLEVAKIDHALAYLKEMPVTELSITALTKLKLTDAISFDLGVPAEKKGRR